jgi:mRNA interferase MazF
MRGDVWDTFFPAPVGRHPAVVLSTNRLNRQLGSVVVLLITGTPGPPETHLRLDALSGLTKYDESFVNITDVHTVDKNRLRHRRGRLDPLTELDHVCDMVRTYLGL